MMTHDSRSIAFADHLSINEKGSWSQRWCNLSRQQQLYVYTDRAHSMIQPQRPLYSISLQQYQHVEVSGKYTQGKGQWELTLSSSSAISQRQWNDSNDSLVTSTNRANRVPSRTKRLYQLVSGNASTQTLSALPETTTSNKIIFRGTDSRIITQWADAISEQLSKTSNPIVAASVIPSHARVRRTRPATATVAEDYADSYANRDSSMISAAALASRRKRLDSLGRTLETSSASQLSRDQDTLSKATARPFTAADKFIKASRRISVEVFASALGNRKSSDTESINQSRPTTSSGASMRSSICCPGLDSKRVSIENKPSLTMTSNFTSFATFSSPFVSTIRRSSSRRRQSTSSNGTNRSSVHFDPTTLASITQPASVRPASVLPSSASAFDISFSSSSGSELLPRERTSSGMTRSTSYSNAPQTPSIAQTSEPQVVKAAEERIGMKMPKSLSTAFGLNLYEEQRAVFSRPVKGNMDPLPGYRPSIAHAIIVESPTNEDLATLIANGSDKDRSAKSNVSSLRAENLRNTGKLALSPSMPALHETFHRNNDEESTSVAPSGMMTSPSFRFAGISKLSSRKTGLLGFKRAPSPKLASAPSDASLSSRGLGVSTRRPATSSGLRTVVSSPQLDNDHRRGSESNTRTPVVERILPPQEIIATIDRLKKQHSASSLPASSRSTTNLSDYASPNRRNVVLPNWRDERGEVYRPRPTRPIRPELQAQRSNPKLREANVSSPVSTLTTSHTFNELPSLSRQVEQQNYARRMQPIESNLGRMEEQRAQSPSLPVPPRTNRRMMNETHRRMSSKEDKENMYAPRLILESRDTLPKMFLNGSQTIVMRGGSQERPRRPLRSSISENFSLRAMTQVN